MWARDLSSVKTQRQKIQRAVVWKHPWPKALFMGFFYHIHSFCQIIFTISVSVGAVPLEKVWVQLLSCKTPSKMYLCHNVRSWGGQRAIYLMFCLSADQLETLARRLVPLMIGGLWTGWDFTSVSCGANTWQFKLGPTDSFDMYIVMWGIISLSRRSKYWSQWIVIGSFVLVSDHLVPAQPYLCCMGC